MSSRVIAAVADVRDVDPVELPSLYDVIDPDALDRLFGSNTADRPNGPGRVVFTLAGCEVVVESDGEVLVTGPRDRSVTPTGVFDAEHDDPGTAAE